MGKFSFFKELEEAKLVKVGSQLSNYTYRDILDYTFLYMLILEMLREEDDFKGDLKKYAAKTLSLGQDFDKFRPNQTDLYFFLHVLFGKDSKHTIEDLKDNGKNIKLASSVDPNKSRILKFLNAIRFDRYYTKDDSDRWLFKLEKELLINSSSLKNIRRDIRNWDNKTDVDKEESVKLIIKELRKVTVKSELYKIVRDYRETLNNKEHTKEKRTFDKSILESAKELEDPFSVACKMLGQEQRGAPEMAMLRVQHLNGGGVLNPVVEHTGDLIHRMTHMIPWGPSPYNSGIEFVGEKTKRMLWFLKSNYGFVREMEENFLNNANANLEDPRRFRERVTQALRKYADEHRKLPVYNKLQYAAREAAIAVGEERWNDAIKYITIIDDAVNLGPEAFNRLAREHKAGHNGFPLEYPYPITEAKYADLGITSFGIPRRYMPQIIKGREDDFLEYLEDEGVSYEHVEMRAGQLKPTQGDYDPNKIQQTYSLKRFRPIIMSKDNYILDGHHRWLNAWNRSPGARIKVIKVYLNIEQLLSVAENFDGVEYERLYEDGRVVKGVNTTCDVDTDSISKESKKLGFDVNTDGYPKETST